MEGWIKLHRKLVDWEWYSDNPVKIVFIHLLLTANYAPKQWQGQTIEAGEKVTSIGVLAEETGLTIKQVRLALNKLENTGEIIKKGTNKYTLIKVVNYSLYQDCNEAEGQPKGNQRANEGQSKGNQRATNKKNKNIKNNKNDKNIYGEFQNVLLSGEEYQKISEQGLLDVLEELSGYIASSGKRYKSHYATILNWSRRKDTQVKKSNKIKSEPTFDINDIKMRTDMGTDIDALLAEFD